MIAPVKVSPPAVDAGTGARPSPPIDAHSPVQRIIGRCGGTVAGPTVVLIGAIHGNEPAGSTAIRRVLDRLDGAPIRGEVVGVHGNLAALAAGRRYLDRDLNRRWLPDALRRLERATPESLEDEDREQLDLLRTFEGLIETATEPVVFLDLHTASGPGAPFACMADVIRNRSVAFSIPVPVVLGLEEVIEGSMLGYLCDLGHVGVAVEGGQHEDPEAAERLETAVWLTLVSTGAIGPDALPDLDERRQKLHRDSERLPAVVEIKHRHVCREGDGFSMVPGYGSFQAIRKGERLARDARGDIRAPQRGLLMLPRYQGSGEDGFFIAQPVRRIWLDLSARLRRAGADRFLPRLPGVIPHPERAETYLVDPRVARVRVADVFHLFGYRRIRPEGRMLAFSRRRPDDRHDDGGGDRGPTALPPPSPG